MIITRIINKKLLLCKQQKDQYKTNQNNFTFAYFE